MDSPNPKLLLILDDREISSGDVRNLVGSRRYGDIIFRGRPLTAHFRSMLPVWADASVVHIRDAKDLTQLRSQIEVCADDCATCIIAGRAGFAEPDQFTQFVERLPYAKEDFTDRLYKPLVVFLRNAHFLVERWPAFEAAPVHTWERAWQQCQRLESIAPLDLAETRDFLPFISGATIPRHFNEMSVDRYYYTKSSSDCRKILAEYSFYGLVPETMRPWLIQPFEFQEAGSQASYKTLRYYLADAALQWIHGAFDAETFRLFIDRLMFFLAERPRKSCSKESSLEVARQLFLIKLESRVEQFLDMEEGRKANNLAASATPALDVNRQLERFRRLYTRFEKGFVSDHLVVGHGDPCFSNVLYDQQRYLLKLIDPKGALNEEELWTHPLYDLCKISHSALGDYDFIVNGLYSVGFAANNDLTLQLNHSDHLELKQLFLKRTEALVKDRRIMRLGEASLFLSMLPLHIDSPNKVVAFLLKANQILNEVEGD